MVNLKERVIQEPKELSEVMDCAEKLTVLAVGPGSAAEKLAAAMGLLPDLVKAGEGFQAVADEVKDEHVYESAGAFAGRIAKAIIAKKS